MNELRKISRRAASFAYQYVATGGNATLAARKAGYSRATTGGMAATGARLLSNRSVLALIAGQIVQEAPGHERALARLMRPSRSPRARLHLQMLLGAHAVPILAEDPKTGSLRLTLDPEAEALTAYAAQLLTSRNLAIPDAPAATGKTSNSRQFPTVTPCSN